MIATSFVRLVIVSLENERTIVRATARGNVIDSRRLMAVLIDSFVFSSLLTYLADVLFVPFLSW